jgi:release factor glutamine methyltransferase
MPDSAPWTIGRLLQWTTEYLQSRGSESPRLDAEVLLAHSLARPRIALYTAFEEVPSDDARTVFRDLVRRRAEGVPVAYLVGYREFYSLRFQVTPDVLIPRPETEHLVIGLLDLARARTEAASLEIADVGTGSGIIAVCAAKHLPGAHVLAIDRCPAALAVARRNAQTHAVADRVVFAQADLLDGVAPEPRFDFIVSNPPYVASAEFDQLARDVREHEPREALLAGERGTEVIERLVPEAARRLKGGGHLLLEISPMIHDAVCGIVRAEPSLRLEPTIKDLARMPRVVHACKADG